MNLLQLLLGSMMSSNSVNSVSNKTGINSKLVQKLIVAAVPLLIKYMTKNASSASGAQSLLGALMQHKGTRSMSEQIDEADEADGEKIIHHILGNDEAAVVRTLADETGLKNEEVTRGLASFAPALLSGLSAATNASAQNSSTDLSSLLGMFGGSQQSVSSASSGLQSLLGSFLGAPVQQPQQTQQSSGLGSLFGLGSQSQSNNAGFTLAQPQQQTQQTQQAVNPLAALFGVAPQPQQTQQVQQTQSADPLGSLLGSLFGAPQQTQQVQQPQSSASAIDGTQLLNLLTAMMKQ